MGKLTFRAAAAAFALLAAGCSKPQPEPAPVPAKKPEPVVLAEGPASQPSLSKPVDYEGALQRQFGSLVDQTVQRVKANAPLPASISPCLIELREDTMAHQVMQIVRSHDEMVRVKAGRYAELAPLGAVDAATIDKAGQRVEKLQAECRRQMPVLGKFYNPVFDTGYAPAAELRVAFMQAFAQQTEHLMAYADEWAESGAPKLDKRLCPALDGATDVWRQIGIKRVTEQEGALFSGMVGMKQRLPQFELCPPLTPGL